MDGLFVVFKIEDNCVLYDPLVNKFCTIPSEVYDYLLKIRDTNKGRASEPSVEEYLRCLKENTCLLSSNSFPAARYPDTMQQLEYKLHHRQKQLVLELTKSCNFRCKYCILSDIYDNQEQYMIGEMSLETLKKSIDFFINNSSDVDTLTISFYGGEPLLQFDQIKYCVHYVKDHTVGKKVRFSMTTNGSLLDQEKIDFLVKHEFIILISLDGPKEIHDMNREFVDGQKTYDIIIKKLKNFKENYPRYFDENVSFHAVIALPRYTNEVIGYFNNSYKNNFGYAYVEPGYNKEKFEEKYFREIAYLDKYPNIDFLDAAKDKMVQDSSFSNNITNLFDGEIAKIFQLKQRMQNDDFWPSGTCDIGSRRIFVDVNGKIFPCEKIPYHNEENCIGNVNDGFDMEKINEIVTNYIASTTPCRTCWCANLCKRCWKQKNINERYCDNMRKSVYRQIEDALTLFFKNPALVRRYDKVEFK